MSVIICAPRPGTTKLVRHRCPTEDNEQDFLMEHTEWYGATHTCLNCGDAWQDGERLERPFAPKWRERSIASARRRLVSALQQASG